jgi:hypothetical protein
MEAATRHVSEAGASETLGRRRLKGRRGIAGQSLEQGKRVSQECVVYLGVTLSCCARCYALEPRDPT